MSTNEGKIQFDPRDLSGMRELMAEYGDSLSIFPGENEKGEHVTISICKDKIVTLTAQANGWDRENIYYADGSSDEIFHKDGSGKA